MIFSTPARRWLTALALAGLAGCSSPSLSDGGHTTTNITPESHTWFPIATGEHAIGRVMSDGTMSCESCHPATSESFTDFTCLSCHGHDETMTRKLHAQQVLFSYESDGRGKNPQGCYSCHLDGTRRIFHHIEIAGDCASCHDVGTWFAALPGPGQLPDGGMHPSMGGSDCGSCHIASTVTRPDAKWKDVGAAPSDLRSDPGQTYPIDEKIPTYSGTSIVDPMSDQHDDLVMSMNHQSTQIPAIIATDCKACHTNSGLFPGVFHQSLDTRNLPQPTACLDCHDGVSPSGFVGPLATSPARTPASGEMKHDGAAWANGQPTSMVLVPHECGVCHTSPLPSRGDWQMGFAAPDGGVLPVTFHASLTKAGQAQPTSCLDCHANTRPSNPALVSLPGGLQYDHAAAPAMGDCATCHAKSAPTFTSWSGGQFHAAGSATPTTCAACHESERPATGPVPTTASFMTSPFDYVTNVNSVKHGDGQDCAGCHTGPGSGAWGGTQNWKNGHFGHASTSPAGNSCITCHTTQRPTTIVNYTEMSVAKTFNHTINGAGDCFGCHQATVTANTYVNIAPIPGSDWKGGQTYPGSNPASSDQTLSVTEYTLVKSGPNNLVTSMTSAVASYHNVMVHTSPSIPASIAPGTMPDQTTCAKCHTHDSGGNVTAFINGRFHSSLTALSLPQPSTGCGTCHDVGSASNRPHNLVQKAGGNGLIAMDHSGALTAPGVIGDCSTCHNTAGNTGSTWADGVFHTHIPNGTTPAACVTCHYPTMLLAASDTSVATPIQSSYAMKHQSGQITFQQCATCHTGALLQATVVPPTVARWQPGQYHNSLTTQPTAGCVDCHALSVPGYPTAASTSTQSTDPASNYVFALGGTATNGHQWLSHGSTYVAGKDCSVCHAADARKLPPGPSYQWNTAALFHPKVTNPTACQGCHGLSNGKGTVPGTNNNLPSGLTDSTMVSAAIASPNTGIPAGTKAQIIHSDVNVTGHDCNFCHTQVGTSTVAGVQGKEWAQASFHARFTSASPLLMNGTTGRCSNCHMKEKPGTAYTGQNHSAFTNVSGTQDCSSCHTWPGTGSTTAPDWKGAAGTPQYITIGGFPISAPPAASGTTQPTVTTVPHPTVATGQTCSTCHPTATPMTGARNAFGYDHALAPSSGCVSCHEAGSNLIGTKWTLNATGAVSLRATCSKGSGNVADRAGDTRPIGIASIACGDRASSKTCGSGNCSANHFYPTDCVLCHSKPASGLSLTKTGQPYVTGWKFNHPSTGGQNVTCCQCHAGTSNCRG